MKRGICATCHQPVTLVANPNWKAGRHVLREVWQHDHFNEDTRTHDCIAAVAVTCV